MKVILKSDIKERGSAGEVISVKDGYARNFLLPRGYAVIADPKNMKALEHEQKKLREMAKKMRKGAESLAERISSAEIIISAKAGEEEKLFGSVTSMDIAESLRGKGIEVDRKKIVLDEPIKRLGIYTVNVKIHADILAPVRVTVVPE